MLRNILIDLNVIVDALLERGDFQAAQAVLDRGEESGVNLYVSSHMVTTLAYLLEASKVPEPEIRKQLQWLLLKFEVVPVDKELLRAAVASEVADFEDAVVDQTALVCRADVIVTGNIRDFKNSEVRAVRAADYLKL